MSANRRFRYRASLLAVLAVGACTTAAPPAPRADVATAVPSVKPQPAPRPPAPPKPVDLHWVFSAAPDTCTALATGPGGSLQVQTNVARQILVTATFTSPARSLPPHARPATFSFNGPAGEWAVPGRWQGRAFTSSRPLDERGVASLLGLLGGGMVAVAAGPLHLGSARLPPSSGEGSAWVQCPKQMMAAP